MFLMKSLRSVRMHVRNTAVDEFDHNTAVEFNHTSYIQLVCVLNKGFKLDS